MNEHTFYKSLLARAQDLGLADVPDEIDCSRCLCEMCFEEAEATIDRIAREVVR